MAFKPLFGTTNTFGGGQPQQSAFGGTAPVFGQSNTGGGGLFGGGGTAAPGGFGAAAGGTSLFGQPKPATGFGAAPQSSFGAPSMGGGTPAFGGGAAGQGAMGGSAFGGAQQNQGGMNLSGGFGGLSTGFGSSAPQSTGFGQPSNSTGFGSAGMSMFGQSSSAFGQTSAPFGSTTPFGGGGGVGGGLGGAKGTTGTKYQVTTEFDAGQTLRFQSISMMPAYKSKSVEELRIEDYAQGNKRGPGDAGGAGAAGGGLFGGGAPAGGGGSTSFGFGNTAAQGSAPWGGGAAASQSAFGASAPAFGATTSGSIFGGGGAAQPSAFGGMQQNNQQQQQQGGGLFGKPAGGMAFGGGASSSGGSLFGGGTTNVFGAAGASSAPSTGTSLFGGGASFGASTAAAPSFSSGLGNTGTGGGLFGGGAPATGGLGGLGQPAQPAQNPVGGGASFNLGGQQSSFSFSAAGNSAGQKPFAAPSLSTPAQPAAGFSGGLFSSTPAAASAPQTSLFNFGTAPATAPTTSLFNTTPAQPTNPQQPLQAFISATPYGSSPLFSSPATAAAQQNGVSLTAAAAGPTFAASTSAPASATKSSPSVYRRTPRSTAKVKARSFLSNNGPVGTGASLSSIFGSTAATPAFPASTFLGGKSTSPWKSPQGTSEDRSAGVKRLVIEPMPQTHGKSSVSRTLTLSDVKRPLDATPQSSRGTPLSADRTADARSNGRLSLSQTTGERPTNGRDRANGKAADPPIKPTPKRSGVSAIGSEGHDSNVMKGKSLFTKDSSGGEEIDDEDRNGSASRSGGAPILTKPEYYTVPSIDELRLMSDAQLAAVEDFTVGREGIGEVRWVGETDVRGMDLDSIVQLEHRLVIVYADEALKPPEGKGLNKPAEVCLKGIFKKDKRTGKVSSDSDAVASMVKKLKAHCEKEGLTFLGYEPSDGSWRFRAEHFSCYEYME